MSTLAGVLGFPVGHSRSPAMMNAAFGELGLDWRYLKLPVPPERFEQTLRALHGSGYRGANVTIPHKVAAHDLADELSDAARAIGAVNTLTLPRRRSASPATTPTPAASWTRSASRRPARRSSWGRGAPRARRPGHSRRRAPR